MIIALNRETGYVTLNGCSCCETYPQVVTEIPADGNWTKDYITLSDLAKQLNEDAALTKECAEFFGLVRNPDTMLWEAP